MDRDRIRRRFPSHAPEYDDGDAPLDRPAATRASSGPRREKSPVKARSPGPTTHASLNTPWFPVLFAVALYATLYWHPIADWNERFLGRPSALGAGAPTRPASALVISRGGTAAAPPPPLPSPTSVWVTALAVVEAYILARYATRRRYAPLFALAHPYDALLRVLENIEGRPMAQQVRDLARGRRRRRPEGDLEKPLGGDPAGPPAISLGALGRATFWWCAFAYLSHMLLSSGSQTIVDLHQGLFGDAVSQLLLLLEARWVASYVTPRRTYLVYAFRFVRRTFFSGPQGLLLATTAVAAYVSLRVVPLMFNALYALHAAVTLERPLLRWLGVGPALVVFLFAAAGACLAALNAALVFAYSFNLARALHCVLRQFASAALQRALGPPRLPLSSGTASGESLGGLEAPRMVLEGVSLEATAERLTVSAAGSGDMVRVSAASASVVLVDAASGLRHRRP